MNGNEKFRLSHQKAIFSIRNLTDWELYTERKLPGNNKRLPENINGKDAKLSLLSRELVLRLQNSNSFTAELSRVSELEDDSEERLRDILKVHDK